MVYETTSVVTCAFVHQDEILILFKTFPYVRLQVIWA
jgi:hypothetical protein